jgi:hypothetical protein
MSLRGNRTILCLVAGAILQGLGTTHSAIAACTSVPGAAMSKATISYPQAAEDSYQVTKVQWDPVLQKKWTWVSNCKHPDWPMHALQSGSNGTSSESTGQSSSERIGPVPMVVRAGDVVRLWHREDYLNIEVTAVAQENGALGQAIRVRMVYPKNAEPQEEKHFTGIVRGPSDLEMR